MSDQPTSSEWTEVLEEIVPEFLVEADDLLESLNQNLLLLDDGIKEQIDQGAPACDKELLNEIFRSAHTLKGLSGMFGFNDINHLTHKIENLFDAARSDKLSVTEDTVDVIIRAIDHVSAMVDGLRDGEVGGVDSDAIQAEIQNVLSSTGTIATAEEEIDLEAALAQATEERSGRKTEKSDASTTSESDLDAALAQASVESSESKTEDDIDLDAALAQALAERNRANAESQSPTDSQPNARESSDLENEDRPAADLNSASDDPFAAVVDDEGIPANYLAIFVDETETSLDTLTEILLEGVKDSMAEQLLVVCHRIKGSAASIGLNRAAALAHVMEDLLQDLEEKSCNPTPDMADALLSCTDVLRRHIEGLKQGASETCDFKPAYNQLIASRSPSVERSQEVISVATEETTLAETETINQASPKAAEEVAQLNNLPPSQEDLPALPSSFDQTRLNNIIAAAPAGLGGYALQIDFRRDLLLAEMKARLLFEKLSQFGDVFYCEPPEEDLDKAINLTQLTVGVATQEPECDLRAALSIEGVEQLKIEVVIGHDVAVQDNNSSATGIASGSTVPKPEDSPEEAQPASPNIAGAEPVAVKANATSTASKNSRAAAATTETTSKAAETIRVDIDRLDQLMNLAGQLVINKARFSQIGASMKRSVGGKSSSNTLEEVVRSVEQLNKGLEESSTSQSVDKNIDAMRGYIRRVQAGMESLQRQLQHADEMRLSVNDLFEAVHQLDRVSDGIQKGVMDTRMVPVGPLFGRFKRVVRDISRSSGKEIRLDIRGEHTELDKRMIDELGDPLIHIVRNSADHGIESPDQREAAGKPREGTVILDAAHRGNSIVIEIIDDGKGLDTERIRAKAIEKGVVSDADAEKLTDYQVHQLIWEPGFSTAEQVTNVSGRGMGMDIVRSKIEEINGVVEMHSTRGQGTRIAIKLPLTLAILPSLLAEIEGDVFAVPVESVSEIVSLTSEDLTTVHGLPTATVRGKTISVVNLPSLFHWSHPGKKQENAECGDETILVIVESEGQLLGLIVDRLLGEEDIVIKSLAENYQNVDGVAGASILGDGRVSLILDTTALLAAASGQAELQVAV